MNALGEILLRRIDVTGPMSLAEYMTECLLHPTHGYYTQATVFGTDGDFTTAPEISQMFGEVLGIAFAQSWMDQGAPTEAVLAEAGPGRGTLMSDMLRAMRPVPGLHDALSVNLIEASPRLRELQQDALAAYSVRWVERAADLPDAPLFFIANEFLDALPIRQFQRAGSGWRERMVVRENDRLGPALGEVAVIPELSHRIADTGEGDVVEICPTLPSVVTEISARIVRRGGAAIFVDYGGWRSRGDTLQALCRHAPTDPFDDPGKADLTTHVDFEAIALAARAAGAATSAMVEQGTLLEQLGITARAQALARAHQDSAALENHIAAHRRLTHPQEMGSLFKAIAIFPRGSVPPPGFDQ